jgi:4a-hydroxytetrahydrobiopterin dehydratase
LSGSTAPFQGAKRGPTPLSRSDIFEDENLNIITVQGKKENKMKSMENVRDLEPLDEKAIRKKLVSYSGWKLKDNKLVKTLQFKDFSDGLSFLNKLNLFCNKIDHHPDVHIYYRKWIFELTRYSIGGKVTDRDFKVARKIDDLIQARGQK